MIFDNEYSTMFFYHFLHSYLKIAHSKLLSRKWQIVSFDRARRALQFSNLFKWMLTQKCADDQVSSWRFDRSVQAQYGNIENRWNSGVCNAFGVTHRSYWFIPHVNVLLIKKLSFIMCPRSNNSIVFYVDEDILVIKAEGEW